MASIAIAYTSLFRNSNIFVIGKGYLSTKQGPKSNDKNENSTAGFLAEPKS